MISLRRKGLAGLLTFAMVMCALVVLPRAAARPVQLPLQQANTTFIAAADTYVSEASPGTNYGTASTLFVDGGSGTQVESYLRFTVANLAGPVQRAVLRVYVTTNGTANGPAVYGAGAGWTESGLSWSTRPARTSGVIANAGALATQSWVEYDITPLVAGNGALNLVLVADSNDGVVFAARQTSTSAQLVLTLAGGAGATPTATATATPTATPQAGGDAVLVAAGDIAACGSSGDEATAALLDGIAGTIVTLGDNVYESGTASEFNSCYNSSWGRHKARTRPSAGNHDYLTSGASGYYDYFGATAGDPAKGYYSYELGAWHIVVVNSNCSQVGGCGAGSAQEQWLRADLAAHPAACTLAYWHHPRFSSGSNHGSATSMQPIWQALYDANADVVLSGHEHNYERFAPQTASGQADAQRGIRQFVVGTGGKNHYGFTAPIANSEVRNGDTFGVLKLTLRASSYSWQFVPEAGKTFADTGSGSCH